MSKRSEQIKVNREGQVLKQLRLKHKLTMKQAARKAGISDSMVSLIENGRADVPKNTDTLERLLNTYGGITEKYFKELVREFNEDQDDLHYLGKVLHRLSPEALKMIRVLVDNYLEGSNK